MYMAKLNGRILARPDFWTHAIDKLNSIRPFERTFAIDDLSKYLPTVSLKEFSEKCDHIVDTIIWGRPEGTWRRVVNLWLQHANMTVHKEVFRQNAMLLMTDTSIRDFYQPFQDQRCLLFAIPFRNVAESKERKSLAKYLTRAPWIVDIAKEAYKVQFIPPTAQLKDSACLVGVSHLLPTFWNFRFLVHNFGIFFKFLFLMFILGNECYKFNDHTLEMGRRFLWSMVITKSK